MTILGDFTLNSQISQFEKKFTFFCNVNNFWTSVSFFNVQFKHFLSNWSLWSLSLSFSITADNLFPVASYYRDFLLTSKWRSRWVKWTRLHLPNGSIFFEYHIFVRLGLLESFSSNSMLHHLFMNFRLLNGHLLKFRKSEK